MPPVPVIRSTTGRGRRLLAHHLARLSDTLETFRDRLREAVSSAVGETVSGIVRDTVRAVLTDGPTAPPPSGTYGRRPHDSRPMWAREPEDDPWYDDPDGYAAEDDFDDAPPSTRTAQTPAPSRLPRAIAVGFHTTLNWLRRSVGRFPVLTAVTVGLLTAAATYAGGPLAAAAAGLAGSAFNLLSLVEVMHAGADALAAFGTS
jgi:hypothetical protein